MIVKQLQSDIRTLIASVSARRRWQFLFLFVLMIFSALAEVVSLGAVVPFLSILSDPAKAVEQPFISNCISLLGLENEPEQLRWQLTVVFCSAAIIAGLTRFILIYTTARVNFGMVHELGAEVFRRTLYQSYDVHVKRNSSEIVGAIGKVDVVAWAVSFLMSAISAAVMSLAIIATLIFIDPLVSVGVLGGIGLVYGVVSIFTRKALNRNSKIINESHGSKIRTVQEGMGSVRDIILDQSQTLFAERFNQIDRTMRRSQASNAIIGPSPRFGVEALGMVLIASLAYFLTTRDGNLASALPILGALALGAQRLMPLVQLVYRGITYLIGNQSVISDVALLLKQPIAEEFEMVSQMLPFKSSIELSNIAFQYAVDCPSVLENVSLLIPKSTIVGFVGETGSGKSTLLDLIMGLLTPTSGEFKVDGVPVVGISRLNWQQNIAHVPQEIFLRDASFAENIAFGVPKEKIDFERVRRAALQAKIADFIEGTDAGYNGMVGERGVRISGGQRQRIGIARAIYKNSPVLVLDEATSALDSETERAVIDSVLSLNPNLTVLMIAHRLSTLEECDFIVTVDNGRIESVSNVNKESQTR